jgi:hypothetical protein
MLLNADDQMNDGMDRETFKEALYHVITDRFWWDHSVAPVVIHEYTSWKQHDDPYKNRDNYIQVDA